MTAVSDSTVTGPDPVAAVLLPTDRPRRAGVVPACTQTVTARIGTAPDTVTLAAAVIAVTYRYTGSAVSIAVPAAGAQALVHTDVTPNITMAALAAGIAGQIRHETRPPVPAAIAVFAGKSDAYEIAFEHDDGEIRAHYDPRLFDETTARRLLGHVVAATVHVGTAQAVTTMPLLSPEELQQTLVDWNATATELPNDRCLHEAFAANAEAAPDAVAVVQGKSRHTYAAIEAAANRLAHHLIDAGAGPGARIGLCLGRSPELLVAILAALKAGAAYVPFDPDHPPARLAAMVQGADCRLIITDGPHRANLPPDAGLVLVDSDAGAIAAQPASRPAPAATPDDLCYVIYTSGSTGVPKPIALRHRGVLNNLADLNTRFEVGPGDSVLALSSPSFDMSVYELLGMTIAGGTVVIPEQDRLKDPAHWVSLLTVHRITVWNSAPALLDLLTAELDRAGVTPTRLRLAMLGGDWIPLRQPSRLRAHAPGLRFVALGGATEASIHSTVFEVGDVNPEWTSIPYGRPMANQRTYILDDARQPVPIGVPGELHLAGIGLAQGYLGQPENTAARFTNWSYGPIESERIYRTGDVARFGADGLIELLGRRDLQVKVAGLRVELGEVEAALRGQPGVRDAVVTAHRDAQGDQHLVGYVTGEVTEPNGIRARLATVLPSYMLPATVVVLDRLPLSPNGKVDRMALAAPQRRAAEPAGGAPRDEWEERIATTWQEVLGVDRVGRDDNFFALGGDSMKAIRAMPRIDPALKWIDLFQHPTPAQLAAHLRDGNR